VGLPEAFLFEWFSTGGKQRLSEAKKPALTGVVSESFFFSDGFRTAVKKYVHSV